MEILEKRQLNACEDWKKFGEELSGKEIEPFDLTKFQAEYKNAASDKKSDTYIGKFIKGAFAQKCMVTNAIIASKNFLAGFTVLDPKLK